MNPLSKGVVYPTLNPKVNTKFSQIYLYAPLTSLSQFPIIITSSNNHRIIEVLKIIKAYYLLKRYRLSYSPFSKLGTGSYQTYTNKITKEVVKREIRVNPFDKLFWEIFLHELGHHVYADSKGSDRTYRNLVNNGVTYEMYKDEKWYAAVIEEEVFASRFAIKASMFLGIKCDKMTLVKFFRTYTGLGYWFLSKNSVCRVCFTDHVEKLMYKLEKTGDKK